MYVRATMPGFSGLGQDDSGLDLSSVDLGTLTAPIFDTSFLSSPLFLGGIAVLGLALLLSKGKKSIARRRKRSAKKAAVRAQIKALKAEL